MARLAKSTMLALGCLELAQGARIKVNEEALKMRKYGAPGNATFETEEQELKVPIGAAPVAEEVRFVSMQERLVELHKAREVPAWDRIMDGYWGVHEKVKESPGIGIAAIAFLSTTCSGATGFGENIVFQWGFYLLSLLGLTSGNMAESSGLLAVWSWPLGIVQVWILRQHLNWRLALTMGIPACFACIPGALICANYDNVWLKFSFGCFLVFSFIWQVYRMNAPAPAPEAAEKEPQLKPDQMFNLMVVTGVLAGFITGLFAAPGSVVMIFALISKAEKDEIRASFAFMAVVMLAPIRLFVLTQTGSVTVASVGMNALWAFPGGFIGLMLGNFLTRFLSQNVWQSTIIGILLMGSTTFLMAPFHGH